MSAPTRQAAKPHTVLFSWGANSGGQLSQGHTEDLLSPHPTPQPGFIPAFISGGGSHSIILSDDGKCYTCGSNEHGQLGHGSISHPHEVTLPQIIHDSINCEKVVKAAGGWDYSYIVTESGLLYGCGSNAFGQLGIPSIKQYSAILEKIPLTTTEAVLDVGCGLRHTVILAGQDVMTCGSAIGKKGQLGICSSDGTSINKLLQFEKVLLPRACSKPVSVIAGAYHTGLLTDDGQVALWGDNKHGQLACDPTTVGKHTTPILVPQELFGNERVTALYSGWTHLMAVTASGSVYTWGRSDYGQTGRSCNLGNTISNHWQPTRLAVDKPAQVACGSEHSLLLTEAGAVYCWGWNEHGMCGTGDENNVDQPTRIKAFNGHSVKRIGCGTGHSFAIVDS